MSILTAERRATLTMLVDTIHPDASALGTVVSLEAALADVDWNGERWFADAPHESVVHPGHGWQGDGTPADLLGHALDAITAELQTRDATSVVAAAFADEIELGVIASVDLARLLQRHVLVAATGVVVR